MFGFIVEPAYPTIMQEDIIEDDPEWMINVDNWIATSAWMINVDKCIPNFTKRLPIFDETCEELISCVELIRRLDGVDISSCDGQRITDLMHTIIENGHLDLLKCMHQKGCILYDDMVGSSAMSGHLDCLRYLHEQGCSINDPRYCVYATGADSVACLQYLHEHGCPLTEEIYSESLLGSIDCCRYAYEHGCPTRPRPIPINVSDPELVEYVVKNNIYTCSHIQNK
jgi:hypothetical protein